MTERDKIIDIILIADVTERTADNIADTLIENGIGDIAEWKKRAEIAEINDKIKERAVDFCFGCYCQLWCEECNFARECKAMTFASYREQSEFCKNNHLQQAEKEIEEERK